MRVFRRIFGAVCLGKRDDMARKILIVGGTSGIAMEMAKIWASRGDVICLTGRSSDRLNDVVERLRAVASDVVCHSLLFDAETAMEPGWCDRLLLDARRAMGGLDVVLLAHGTLPDEWRCLQSEAVFQSALIVNGFSTVLLMRAAVAQWVDTGGTLAVLSSVAGDRGRASNGCYGSAKSMVSAYASALGQRCEGSNVRVVLVKPGLVRTPMTEGMNRKGFLWANANRVAQRAVLGIDKGTPVVYAPWFWRWVMAVVKGIPEKWFRKMSF